MFVRCAYFEGHVQAQNQARFRDLVTNRLAATMRTFPGVKAVRVSWGVDFEVEDRPIYLALEHAYESPNDLAGALDSPERAGLQSTIEEINSLFEGRIFHVNYDVPG
ncbi:MAG: hypothetical protein AAF493_19030 [Pseudomonadota bacterium]